jgi:hypothetical protein
MRLALATLTLVTGLYLALTFVPAIQQAADHRQDMIDRALTD